MNSNDFHFLYNHFKIGDPEPQIALQMANGDIAVGYVETIGPDSVVGLVDEPRSSKRVREPDEALQTRWYNLDLIMRVMVAE